MSNAAKKPSRFDVLVIGAGPAGLMSAVSAARLGAKTTILEQLDRPGAKLLASGGGRCNFTNTLDNEKFMGAFGRNGRFIQPALRAMDARALRLFFDGLAVPSHSPDGFHVYPKSDSSKSVLDALWQLCSSRKIQHFLDKRVTELCIRNGRASGVKTGRDEIAADHVILATGGQSYPDLGGSGSGYELARQAGHRITPVVPALVPLLTREAWIHSLSGVSLNTARLWIDLPRARHLGAEGGLLFTHKGISGPAVLDLSGDVAQRLAGTSSVPLRIDLTPGADQAGWLSRFESWQRHHGRKRMLNLLDQHLPSSLCASLIRLAASHRDITAAEMRREHREKLAGLLVGLPLTIIGTEGFDHAMVTRGGVSLREVDPHTLESRIVKGLFFAGEVLDLDGPSGGFNLQWAFSSGHLAGLSTRKKS